MPNYNPNSIYQITNTKYSKKIFCTLSFLFFIHIYSFSQNHQIAIPQVSFNSPESSSLGKYVEYPTDLSTGTLDIKVPIFSLPYKNNNLDIVLRYHTAGLKANEESSSVGLGWSLWSGGGITRVLRGKPDEEPQGFLETGRSIPDFNDINSPTVEGRLLSDTSYLAYKYRHNSDVEPDLYYLQAPNLNIEFTVNNEGKYICNNMDSIFIQYDNLNKLFIVINKVGETYRFGKSFLGKNCTERTSSINSFMTSGTSSSSNIPIPSPAFISSWKLTEIISADKQDTVFFDYKFYNTSSFVKTSETRSSALNLLDGNIDQNGNDYGALVKNFSEVYISNISLVSKITYRNNIVDFAYINDRQDVIPVSLMPTTVPRLSNIKISVNGGIIKNFELNNNNYFNRTGVSNSINNMAIQPYLLKSLKLISIKEYGIDPNISKIWEFYYDETPLPALANTNALDFWGYYNGKINASLIPTNYYSNSNLGQPIFNGENRNTDITFMKAGILTKMKFPQGGYSTFEFEPNYYLNKQQQQNKVKVKRSISLMASNPTNSTPTCPQLPPIKNTLEFTVNEDLGGEMVLGNIAVNFSDYVMVGNSYPSAKITNLNNSDYKNFTHLPVNKDKNQAYNDNILIRQGNKYRVELDMTGNTGKSKYGICGVPSAEFYLNYEYWEEVDNTDQVILPTQAGGLRIKKVSNYDSLNKLSDYLIYSYGDSLYGSEKLGVGVLYNDIGNYFYHENVLWYYQQTNASLYNRIFFTSYSNSELGLNNGCPVFYNKVTCEKFGSNNIPHGKTESFFNKKIGELVNLYPLKYRYLNINFPSWSQSNISKEITYSYESNVYSKIREVAYEYGYSGPKKIKTVRLEILGPEYSSAFAPSPTGPTPMFIINDKRFFIQNSFKSIAHTFLKLKIEKDYFGADIVFSEIKTEYGYNNYFDINKMTVSSSTGVKKVFTLKYSGDLNSKLGTNMVSLPVQQETLLGNKVIDGNIFTRLLNGNINQIYKYRGNKPELPLNFLNYNSIPNGYINDKKFIYYTNGVLKSIESLFYPSITYLWGYGGQYPIAEIKNATYAEVEAVLTQTTINNLNSPNVLEATITTAMNKLRTDTRLAKAMVTSYTYQPLVGMKSKTDTRGVTEFYEYDGMQRLKAILDHVKNVTSAMDYHYRPN